MIDKSSFTADEWSKIVGSPILGTLKEGMASASALMDARRDSGAANLIKAVIADLETSEGRTIARDSFKAQMTAKTPSEMKAQAIAALTSIGQLVDAKAGHEAPAFKTWLHGIAERVAAASTEGGFLGFGGVAVSDAEKATLDEISMAMRA